MDLMVSTKLQDMEVAVETSTEAENRLNFGGKSLQAIWDRLEESM